MKKQGRWGIVSLALMVGFLGPLAVRGQADALYGITFGNQLITIDPNTGVGTLVGNLDSPMSGYGLTVHNGNLYTYDQTADLIRQIDPATGHTVASFNIGAGDLLGEGDLAIRSDGTGFLTTTGVPGISLLTFNLAGASSSKVSAEPFLFDGLAFNSSDVLYGMSQGIAGDPGGSQLYTINQTTGAISLIGALNVPAAGTELLGGLTFASNGTLFGELSDGGTTSTLVTINGSTGQATTVGNITGFGNVSGIAFLGAAPAAVPEPSTFVLMGTALIGLIGVVRQRRQ